MLNFNGPFIVLGHPYGRSDLLTLRHVATNNDLLHPINVEKVIVVADPDTDDLHVPNDAIVDIDSDSDLPIVDTFRPQSDLMQIAFESGKYLHSLPSKSSTASQACKFVYQSYLSAWEILSRHGKLRGLVKVCPYLQLDGSPSDGTYILSLNQEMFDNCTHCNFMYELYY